MIKQSITQVLSTTHPQMPGVNVRPIGNSSLQKGTAQQVLVEVEPNATIPMHSHSVDAIMDIVAGSATLLTDDKDLQGKVVSTGNKVFFNKGGLHGFMAGPKGLIFVSTNDGIVGEKDWDIAFA